MKNAAILMLGLTVLASGCISGITGSFSGPDDDSGGDWCDTGQSWSTMNPTTGERVEFRVEGERMIDGRDVCVAVWESEGNNSGEVSRMEMQFTEDGDYSKITLYDENGTVINEIETNN